MLEQVVTDVPDRGEVRYRVTFSADGVRVRADGADTPDVTFATDHATAAAISRGETNAQRALAAGRFRVRGNIEAFMSEDLPSPRSTTSSPRFGPARPIGNSAIRSPTDRQLWAGRIRTPR